MQLSRKGRSVGAGAGQAAPWWQTGVLYQVYLRSFADSNADGIGDLQGLAAQLDYLAWLGVDAIWLSPVGPSPNADWGYDVADYCDVDPALGTLADLDALIAEAGTRGIRVVLDLIPNHTSDRHPWFVDSRSSRDAEHRDWYVWGDPGPDGEPPNNWVSGFGGSAWTVDDATGQAYLHNFSPHQPELNWRNPNVHAAFEGIQRFWLERGIAGFRIDMCNMLVKDEQLRDNPPAGKDDGWVAHLVGQSPLYNSNQPEVHDILRDWRTTTDSYDPPRLLLGETVVYDLKDLARFYGADADELHLALNVPFLAEDFDDSRLRAIVETSEATLPLTAWPVWTGSNHDAGRLASRWAGGDEAKTRLALMMLLTLRGTALLYQGDEIGLTDTTLSHEQIVDPAGLHYWPDFPGRDPCRTPMPWSDEPGMGFTAPGVEPWLPFGDATEVNVRAQRDDSASTLHLVRDLIALRHASSDLQTGAYTGLPSPAGVWAWQRGSATRVVLNFTEEAVTVPMMRGHVALSTVGTRSVERISDELVVAPWEGVVVTLGGQ